MTEDKPREIMRCYACDERFESTGEYVVGKTEVCSLVCYLNTAMHFHLITYVAEEGHC